MARIPVGNFGFSQPTGTPQIQRASAAPIGDAITRVGDEIMQQQTAMARAKAVNAAQSYDLNLKSKAQDISERIARGELNYEDAQKTFDEETSDLQPQPIKHIDPVTAENFTSMLGQAKQQTQIMLRGVVDKARRADFQDQFETNLDLLGKEAGMPGANVEQINSKAAAFAPLAQSAGIPKEQVDKALQNFKDRNWQNQAVQRAMESSQDMNALDKLQHDLTAEDGFYSGKLDTDKRNAILNSVISHKINLQNLLEREALKHETRGERALNQIDRQIASGVPATPSMWSSWASDVKGTQAEAEFSQRLDDERQVQSVLRMPVDQQLKFIQQKQATLDSQGGSVRDATNLARLQSAVKANVTMLQQEPLEFSANRTGQDVQPIDLGDLLNPDGASRMADTMNERVITLNAMRKQYGDAVPMRPLLKSEAQSIGQILEKASPQEATALYATLSNAMGSPDVYTAAMQQIAPDSPVKALAGLIAAKPADITLQHNFFRADVTAPANVVASTMLEGERLLNPTKAAKGQDGKPTGKIFLPESKSLQAEFTDQVGTAFAGRPQAAETAFQAVQAYYVGKAAQSGRLAAQTSDIDSGIMKEAVMSVLGVPVDYNGNGTVLAPWGMDKSTFEDRIASSYATEIKKRGLDNLANTLPALGLRNNGDGTYYLTQGRGFLVDKNGKPVVLNVNQ